MQSEQQSTATNGKPRTGFTIVVAVFSWIVLYVIYRLLFILFVELYAAYDPGFSSGFGAFVLIVLVPNVLAAFGAIIVAVKIFKNANKQAVFYGFATLIVTLTVLSSLFELGRPDSAGAVVVIIYVITAGLSVLAARFALNVIAEQ